LNVLNIAGQATNVFIYAGSFATPLSSIIVTHFLLSLREVAHGAQNGTDNSQSPSSLQADHAGEARSQTPSLRFASFVGNMGEQPDHSSGSGDLDLAWNDECDSVFTAVMNTDSGPGVQDEEAGDTAHVVTVGS